MKNKKISLLAALSAGVLLAGCGDWKQNPLDGKKGNFGEGQPIPKKPELEVPLRSDTVRINLPRFQAFEEGVATELVISARVLLDDYAVELSVENMDDYPGATFDRRTGLFRWTPPAGFVDRTRQDGGNKVSQSLVVKAIARKEGGQVLYETNECPTEITRPFLTPEILSIHASPNYVREGSTATITVDLVDRDAKPGDRSTWPRLLLQSPNGAKSLAGLVSVNRDETMSNGQFRVYLIVDARNAELTDAIATYKIGVVAASAFGKVSAPREIGLEVYTSFATPVATWNEALQIREGETVTHKFLINDPKLEARLELDRSFSLPAGSNIACQETGRGLLNCTFTWTPQPGQAGAYEFQLYVRSRNNDARDLEKPVKSLNFRTQVLPQGS